MANWKKVIVSGSIAELAQLTASNGIMLSGGIGTVTDSSNVLAIDANGNVSQVAQTTIANSVTSVSNAFATASIRGPIAGEVFNANSISASASPDNLTFVSGSNITLGLSGSATGDRLVQINAITSSVAAGTNITTTTTGNVQTINAVTASVLPGTNVTIAASGHAHTINAVTSSVLPGTNITIAASGNAHTINAVTASVIGGTGITIAASGHAHTISLTEDPLTNNDDAFFNHVSASVVSASIFKGGQFTGSLVESTIISASALHVSGTTKLLNDTTIEGSLALIGVQLFEDNVTVRSGSTSFGSGSVGAEVQLTTHKFTGSLLVTGSLTVAGGNISGVHTGDGSGLSNVTATSVNIDGLTTDTVIAQSDKLIFSDAGTEEAITFSNFEDQIFSNINAASTDVAVAAGGAITLANNSVGTAEISTAIAGTGLTGGGDAALAVDLDEVAEVQIDVANDYIAFIDTSATDNDTKKESVADLAAFMAGTGLDASSGVFNVDIIDVIHGTTSPNSGISSSIDTGIEKLELGIHTLTTGTPTKEDFIAFSDTDDGNINKKVTGIDFIANVIGSSLTVSAGDLDVDFSDIGDNVITNDMIVNETFTIGDSVIALGGSDTTLTGLTDIDMTAANHTILDGVGANILTIGAVTTTFAFPGSGSVGGDLTVNGNLTVQGTTVTMNTETLAVEDNFIDLNSNFGPGGVNAGDGPDDAQDAGISIKRGSSLDANFYWDEGADRFALSLEDLSLNATAASTDTYAVSVQLQGSNPLGSTNPVFGVNDNFRGGEMIVNTTTEEIWIYS